MKPMAKLDRMLGGSSAGLYTQGSCQRTQVAQTVVHCRAAVATDRYRGLEENHDHLWTSDFTTASSQGHSEQKYLAKHCTTRYHWHQNKSVLHINKYIFSSNRLFLEPISVCVGSTEFKELAWLYDIYNSGENSHQLFTGNWWQIPDT